MDSGMGRPVAGRVVMWRFKRLGVGRVSRPGSVEPEFPLDAIMRRHVGAGLVRWLRQRPAVWSGWPTGEAVDAGERDARVARLARHGFPVHFFQRPSDARQVDIAIWFLRADRRKALRRQAAMWEGE